MPLADAVIVFDRDGSGSMSEEHIKLVDEISARIEAVTKHQYKKVAIRYVIYSDDAKEVTREEFFSQTIGGGTNALASLNLVNQILDSDYPTSKYNRYVYHFSDGDDSQNEAVAAAVQGLLPRVELYGYGHIDPTGFGVRGLSQAMKNLVEAHEQKEKVGFADIRKGNDSLIAALKEFFGKKKKP
jgi:uncharacterized sporulation protein YeaH/YhbH (DUF444 family)